MPGQTESEIRGLLAGAGLAPQHRFGQNFLIDLNLMRKLAAAAELTTEDVVLEVGPGTGSLTEILLASGARVIAVEVDRGLHTLLGNRFAPIEGVEQRLTLICGDALAGKHRIEARVLEALAAPAPAAGGARKLVANLPYQIATPLLIELLLLGSNATGSSAQDSPADSTAHATAPPLLERMCVTIQREVGERFAAAPRSAQYGAASVIVQSLAEIEVIATLPPQAFWPRPQVESVMLCIRPRPQPTAYSPAALVGLVQRCFQERRKMLRRTLGAPALLERCGISGERRPEELTPQDWQRLAEALATDRPAG